MTRAEIIDRLEKAGVPDRELDAAIMRHVGDAPHEGPRPLQDWKYEGSGRWHLSEFNQPHPGYTILAPAYTASLDAAIALVEKMLPGWRWTVFGPHPDFTERFAHADLWKRDPSVMITEPVSEKAATPALALLLALFRAMESGK